MSVSKGFTDQIQAHLDGLAANDELFAQTLAKPNKNIEECCKYILSEVQRLNVQGMADAEVFALAVHYYDEDDVKAGTLKGNPKVVVNHVVELSQEEKDQAVATAKQKAIDQAIAAETQRITKKKTATKPNQDSQPSLF